MSKISAPTCAEEPGKHSAAERKAADVMKKVFKNNPEGLAAYSEAKWSEVPETDQPECVSQGFSPCWYSCVKRYRFIKYDNGPRAGDPKLIIEVEQMGETTHRHIVKLSKVKGVVSKSSVRDIGDYVRIEQIIIITRPTEDGGDTVVDLLKFKFSSPANALAFHMELESAL